MAVVVACVLALGVTSAVLIWAARKGAVMSGFAVLVGMVAGNLALWALGGGTTLILLVVPGALLLGLAEAVLTARGVHWFWRLLVQGVVIFGLLVLEWRRGDLFASGAAMAAVAGVLVFNVINFAIGAAQRSRAGRLPIVLWLLGVGYLVVIALGLPNPGLRTLALVSLASTAPLLIWPAPSGFLDRVLGPVLAALACALGFYAWLGNASPAMVVAPLLVIGLDVAYALVLRLATASGRAGLADGGAPADGAPGDGAPGAAGAAGWWRRVDAWASPSDDLVAQRAWASSKLSAAAWLVGATVVVLAFSLLQWWIGVPWLVALAVLLVPALGWLALQAPTFSASRQALLVALSVVSAVAVLAALAAWRLDGRLLVAALPLLALALVWGVAVLTRREALLPAKTPA